MYKLSNGVLIPKIGFGTWKSTDPKTCQDSVRIALEVGYKHVDTAKIYKNEEYVGAGIKAYLDGNKSAKREELFITTKLWNGAQGYESTLSEYEASLKNLGLDYIDLYLIHWPNPKNFKTTLDSWRAFEKLYEDKKVRAIGVCNFKIHHLEELAKIAKIIPMINQIELHPELQQEETRKYCKENGIVVESWSPLMQGNLDNATLLDIAKKYNKSVAQVILKWHLQNDLLPLPKSVTPSRIKENFELEGFSLDADDIAKIAALQADHRYGPDPDTMEFGF
ncbi:MAG: aldo/keto reductase [Fusobacteriaceae bacterium]|jgi:diketogulonate reductase-like aldo/keto reductase|nr:aldo/keto reductase [Fusobacteriaceae bacterium]